MKVPAYFLSGRPASRVVSRLILTAATIRRVWLSCLPCCVLRTMWVHVVQVWYHSFIWLDIFDSALARVLCRAAKGYVTCYKKIIHIFRCWWGSFGTERVIWASIRHWNLPTLTRTFINDLYFVECWRTPPYCSLIAINMSGLGLFFSTVSILILSSSSFLGFDFLIIHYWSFTKCTR